MKISPPLTVGVAPPLADRTTAPTNALVADVPLSKVFYGISGASGGNHADARRAASWRCWALLRRRTVIVEAAVWRLRPVVLTVAVALPAMIPLTRSVFRGPKAISIMGGLIVATALTLVLVPTLLCRIVPGETGAEALPAKLVGNTDLQETA
jgi:hypothetical protein